MPEATARLWLTSALATWGAALCIAVLWSASLPLNAFELGQFPVKWYSGMTMFIGGAMGQIIIFPSILGIPHWYLAWWSNLALFAVFVRLVFLSRPRLLVSSLPLVLAAFTFTIRKFGLPDDSEAPVVGYGAGVLLWMLAMAVPLALRLATLRALRSQPRACPDQAESA